MRTAAFRGDGERGSALIVVLVVMTVITVGALALGAVVAGTTATLAGSRSLSVARAAADAGVADAVAAARRGIGLCGLEAVSSELPRYRVAVTCVPGAGQAVVRATGSDDAGSEVTVEAAFSIVAADARVPDVVVRGVGVTALSAALRSADATPLVVGIPSGPLRCTAAVDADVIVAGDADLAPGCAVGGDLTLSGRLLMPSSGARVGGDVGATGGGHVLRGLVDGGVALGGAATFGGGGAIGGDVVVSGAVVLGDIRIEGSLTHPVGAPLTVGTSTVAGGIRAVGAVPPPPLPDAGAWSEWDLDPEEWPGFDVVELAPSGDPGATCDGFGDGAAPGWAALSQLTAPTIVDARGCVGGVSAAGGATVELTQDVAVVADLLDLTGLDVTGAARAWFLTADTVSDGAPSCPAGGGARLDDTSIGPGVSAVLATPCSVAVGADAVWRGTVRAGGLAATAASGALTVAPAETSTPGLAATPVSTGRVNLGALLSRRDLP